MKTAGEGGAWGIALLASYLVQKEEKEKLDTYLKRKVFLEDNGSTIYSDEQSQKRGSPRWVY